MEDVLKLENNATDFVNYLKASTPAEKQIRLYIIDNASDELKAKIMASNKNVSDCLDYISNKVKNKAKNNCYVGSDEEIYGMAIHYFEEDSIKAGSSPKVANVESSEVEIKPSKYEKEKIKAEKKKKKEEPKEPVPNLFDFLGDN